MSTRYLDNDQMCFLSTPSPDSYYGEEITDICGKPMENFIGSGESNIEKSNMRALTNCTKREINQKEIEFILEIGKFCFLCNDYKKKKNIFVEKIGFNVQNGANVIKKSNNEKYVFFTYKTTNINESRPCNYEVYMSERDGSIKRLSFFSTTQQTEALYPINPLSLCLILLSIYVDINNLTVENQAYFISTILCDKNLSSIKSEIIKMPTFAEIDKILKIK